MEDKTMCKDEALRRIKTVQKEIAQLGVSSLGLFGSFVKNTQTDSSDVDILVEFLPGQHSFDNFMELAFLLERVLERKVDLVTRIALSPYIGPHILKEVENVPLIA